MKLQRLYTTLALTLALQLQLANAQQGADAEADSTTVVRLLADARRLPADSNLALHFARQFLGRPYVAHTLEVNDREQLVVNTRQLDCTTLVENVVALTRCARQGLATMADFRRQLTRLRYRQGQLTDYTSRLHYFSDWIDDKRSMGLVTELQSPNPPFTAVQTLNINYMSTHPQSYKALRQQPRLATVIARQERQLTGRKYRFIPKSSIGNTRLLRQTIHDGDIIAITCRKAGLDIAHLGFAVWRSDGLHLLNASQLHKRVVEEPMTLEKYLSKHPSHTGIRIVRINQK